MPAEGPAPSPSQPGASEPGPTAQATTVTAGHRSLLYGWSVAFGRFWWDFLVGDTPELLIGVLIALGVVALLVKGAERNAVAVVALPVMVAAMLGVSVYRARPKR